MEKMNALHVIVWILVAVSGLSCLLIIREFLSVSAKREHLLNNFGQDMRGTKQSRTVLIVIYVLTTVISTLGFSRWFFILLP